MFEPIHGSAPDIKGQDIANPFATIWTQTQLLEFLGEPEWAQRVFAAMQTLIEKGQTTPDMGGTRHTSEVGDLLAAAVRHSQ